MPLSQKPAEDSQHEKNSHAEQSAFWVQKNNIFQMLNKSPSHLKGFFPERMYCKYSPINGEFIEMFFEGKTELRRINSRRLFCITDKIRFSTTYETLPKLNCYKRC